MPLAFELAKLDGTTINVNLHGAITVADILQRIAKRVDRYHTMEAKLCQAGMVLDDCRHTSTLKGVIHVVNHISHDPIQILRILRRLRSFCVKALGAAGAAIHVGGLGMMFGVAVGVGLLIFDDDSFGVENWNDDGEVNASWQQILFSLLFLLVLKLAAKVMRPRAKPEIFMWRCIRLGLIAGLLLGKWWHAFERVNPDTYGFWSSFEAGITGRLVSRPLM